MEIFSIIEKSLFSGWAFLGLLTDFFLGGGGKKAPFLKYVIYPTLMKLDSCSLHEADPKNM